MLLKNKKIIVTGGPTREWLDPVRFLSNPSSGKMGISIADAAFLKTENVTFIHGPIDLFLIKEKSYKTVSVETTEDMLKSVLDELIDGAILVMAAAPADYTAKTVSKEKMKKTGEDLILQMKRTPDILKNVSAFGIENDMNLFLVGFAAETIDVEKYAKSKLISKNIDMICSNDVSKDGSGFGVDTNSITVFSRDGKKSEYPNMPKVDVAKKIIEEIEKTIKS